MDGSLSIIAQTVFKNLDTLGTGVGIGGIVIGTVSIILKRQVDRMITHADDNKIHIDPLDPPMKRSVCEANHSALLREMQQMNDSLATITKHIMSEKKY